jgi:uncharacterized glyoxalase superfamily protein PhnB
MATITRLIPLLVYEDIVAAHDFLVGSFGFAPGRIDRSPDGEVVHGEVHSEAGPIWLHRVTADHELASPATPQGQQGHQGHAAGGLVVHVADVDAHFEHARAAGARIDSEPRDQPYGQREYGARDPEGHRWWFATPLPADGAEGRGTARER